MKRLLFIVPFVLFLLILNACGNNGTPPIPPAVGTQVAQTQTASVWTATISPTPQPNTAKMVDWINGQLSRTDPLERMLDAEYTVADVTFPSSNGNGILDLMRLEVHCTCARDGGCCTPERMFVAVVLGLAGMDKKDNFIGQVPATVTEMDVACYDHLTPFGTMAASWTDIQSYLNGEINGTQLGSRVWRK
jgi:hypothetical protein